MQNNKDTIVAVSTAVGEGGIGIVRLSGERAVRIADKIFAAKGGGTVSGFGSHTVHYGHVIRSADKGIVDEVLLTIMRAPRTYTREDVVEISCHGGAVALKEVMQEAVLSGARPAGPGEFTKRAFLNGRIDLAQAEGVIDVIRSKTDASLRVAMAHLEGDYSREIKKERQSLIRILEEIEADIDFQDEHHLSSASDAELLDGLKRSKDRLAAILSSADAGRMLQEGVTCVICGKPNVGKSSLLNALLKRSRAIVTPIPGTTRDAIEDFISVSGVPVKLVDTAGIQPSKDAVEKIGIRKSKEYLKKADIAIFVLDFNRRFDDNDRAIQKMLPKERTIIVANKSDLKDKLRGGSVRCLAGQDIIPVSVKERKNVTLVEKKLSEMIWQGKAHAPEYAFITNLRHAACVKAALKSAKEAVDSLTQGAGKELIAVDVRQAVFELGKITGESVDVNILDRIFEKFCIGK